MIRRPPRSTLFPTRRSSDLDARARRRAVDDEQELLPCPLRQLDCRGDGTQVMRRSEEHTSELQSRLHLVCRLLLEKKKTITSQLSSPPRTPSLLPTSSHHNQ